MKLLGKWVMLDNGTMLNIKADTRIEVKVTPDKREVVIRIDDTEQWFSPSNFTERNVAVVLGLDRIFKRISQSISYGTLGEHVDYRDAEVSKTAISSMVSYYMFGDDYFSIPEYVREILRGV